MDRSVNNKMRCGRPLIAALVLILSSASALADSYEGFTEPYRTINVAASETGIIAELLVGEGDEVQAGQPLAKLNDDVQQALLAIAKQSMQAKGQLDAAIAELNLRKARQGKLKSLLNDGYARQEEFDRASTEVEVARANVLTAREELLNRKLQHAKIKVQLDRRTIRAPIAGVVTTLHKQMGEFVAPNNPDVLTIVELDPLLANFTVSSLQAELLQYDQPITVLFTTNGLETTGYVESISPVTDAESGTVRIKIRVENPAGRFRSGERCRILLDD